MFVVSLHAVNAVAHISNHSIKKNNCLVNRDILERQLFQGYKNILWCWSLRCYGPFIHLAGESLQDFGRLSMVVYLRLHQCGKLANLFNLLGQAQETQGRLLRTAGMVAIV